MLLTFSDVSLQSLSGKCVKSFLIVYNHLNSLIYSFLNRVCTFIGSFLLEIGIVLLVFFKSPGMYLGFMYRRLGFADVSALALCGLPLVSVRFESTFSQVFWVCCSSSRF